MAFHELRIEVLQLSGLPRTERQLSVSHRGLQTQQLLLPSQQDVRFQTPFITQKSYFETLSGFCRILPILTCVQLASVHW